VRGLRPVSANGGRRAALIALALAVAAPAARAGQDEALVNFASRALWDDHTDVRNARFLLRRAGVDPAETADALARLLPDRPALPADRVRTALLLGRIGVPTETVLAALRRCLREGDGDLRWAAAAALETLEVKR
jgi:hypothetical protein